MQTEENRKASRVVDMSWAADYLDDTWENEHAAKGAYDTQVLPPLRKYMQPEAAEVNPLSSTQEFKAVDNDGEDEDDDLHIVDAVTDRTIASKEEVLKVRSAAGRMPEIPEEEEDLKIRDAVTDKTVASIEEVHAVRRAAAFFDLREDLSEREGIRDALSERTVRRTEQAPISGIPKMPAFMNSRFGAAAKEPASVREPETSGQKESMADFPRFTMPDITGKKDAASAQAEWTAEKEPAPEPDKTIVASKETKIVRDAASGFRLEELFRDEEESFEPEEDDLYDQYEDLEDYDDLDDAGAFDGEDGYDDYDGFEGTEDFEEDEEPVRPGRSADRRSQKYYYGYKQPGNPLRFIPLVLVVAICVFGFIVAMQICHDVPLNASDYSKVKYTVQADLTDEQLSQDLKALGIIDNPLVFKLRCKFYSADYVPGVYELSPCYSTEKIINILSGYTYGTDD